MRVSSLFCHKTRFIGRSSGAGSLPCIMVIININIMAPLAAAVAAI